MAWLALLARIAAIIAECQETCRFDHGGELDESTLEDVMKDRRQALRDELENNE